MLQSRIVFYIQSRLCAARDVGMNEYVKDHY